MSVPMYGNGRYKHRSQFSDRHVLLGLIALIALLYTVVSFSRLRQLRNVEEPASTVDERLNAAVYTEGFEAYNDTIVGEDTFVHLFTSTTTEALTIQQEATSGSGSGSGSGNATITLPSGLELPHELPPQCRPGGWRGVVFLHVPKAAGSFYRDIVLRRIGEGQKQMLTFCKVPDNTFYLCPKDGDDDLRARELAYYSAAFTKNCTFMSSHNDHSLLDRVLQDDPQANITVDFYATPPAPIFKILPVRDPVDLAASLYHHIHFHYPDKAANVPFPAWVNGQVRDLQTRMLLGDRGCFGSKHRIDSMTDMEIEAAIAARLNTVCVVLLQDDTRAGVGFLNYAMGWGIGPHQLEIISNREFNKAGGTDAEVEALKTEENAQLIREHYRHDLVLLEMARRRAKWQQSFLDDDGGGTTV